MRTLLCVLVLTACASAGSRTQPADTVLAGSMPSNAPQPEAATAPDAGPTRAKPQVPAPGTAAPVATGPMTAAEAAAALAERSREGRTRYSKDETVPFGQPDAEEDAPCKTDDDCTTTRVGPHACCPMLCEPRAVTKKAAQVIEAHTKSCTMFKCPEPMCRPPRQSSAPACVQNRCVMKPLGAAGPN